jgi:hypothetical protein
MKTKEKIKRNKFHFFKIKKERKKKRQESKAI